MNIKLAGDYRTCGTNQLDAMNVGQSRSDRIERAGSSSRLMGRYIRELRGAEIAAGGRDSISPASPIHHMQALPGLAMTILQCLRTSAEVNRQSLEESDADVGSDRSGSCQARLCRGSSLNPAYQARLYRLDPNLAVARVVPRMHPPKRDGFGGLSFEDLTKFEHSERQPGERTVRTEQTRKTQTHGTANGTVADLHAGSGQKLSRGPAGCIL
jgi:hypothetical protein